MSKRFTTTVAAVASVAAAAAINLAGTTAAGAAGAKPTVEGDKTAAHSTTAKERKGNYDARAAAAGRTGSSAAALRAKGSADATARLRALVGKDAMISIDPATGTVANLASWTGYLTGPSRAAAKDVALGYVRRHAAALGLSSDDVASFVLRKDYVDVAGAHHLSFNQVSRGVTVYGNGLKAHVGKDGRLLALQGAPIAGLKALTGAASISPKLAAAAARSGAAKDVGGAAAAGTAATRGALTRWSNNDQARLVWFVSNGTARLAWSTYTQAGGGLNYAHVLDADTGSVLLRKDLRSQDKGDALVYDYYPGASRGGTAKVVNFYDKGWLGRNKTWLQGTNVSAWADVNDDNLFSDNEITPVPGTTAGRPQFRLQPFDSNRFCSARFVCTWDPRTEFSWRTNKAADVTNAFYLANTFHDWLQRSSVGFTPAAGNFERIDGDPVLLNALDGANTASGLPDGNHVNNANMSTPPDGIPPTMQMFLFHAPGASAAQDPFLPISSSFDASILYHEYTHGLSNRLVVDADGNSGLNSFQDGSMGEAWSDYFAMDFLVGKGFQPDTTAVDGQVRAAKYTLADKEPFRTEAIDCDPGSTAAACTKIDGTKGGYTYGELPTIGGFPEVHSSGEVWAQLLWDMRERFGQSAANNLIARGMELSVTEPTMLDMRNAIIQADKLNYRSSHSLALWRIFAARGMGWFAGTVDAGDTTPAEDFRLPPSPDLPRGTAFGLVVDSDSGARVSGATVQVTGHPEYSDTTDANGVYVIDNVRGGTYKKVVAGGPGFTLDVKPVTVPKDGGAARTDFTVRRDWAAGSGGGAIVDFNGPDFSFFGCGPAQAIDLKQGSGWGSTTGDNAGTPTNRAIPKFVEVSLPRAIDIKKGRAANGTTAFRVDPSNVCGDPGSSSTNEYRIQVSANGRTWTTVVDAAFGTIADPDTRGRYFDVASNQAVGGVRFVRFWMDSPQVPDFATNCPAGAFGGCVFMDMTEVQVFGAAS
ncbi:MAG TPA: M36 family metallopeptidase [Dermatophilaceae bacterium]|nr:M36 family metallopeptidase [Dermatophilaceae bacterium]